MSTECKKLRRLLKEARDCIPNWTTGVNTELLAEIDAVLQSPPPHLGDFEGNDGGPLPPNPQGDELS
jgi:hypothetical protein